MKPISFLLSAVLIAGLTAMGLTDARSDNATNMVAASSSAKKTAPEATLELRDGSRIIGNCLDDPIRFHSEALGDFKLPVEGIRSIEFKVNAQDDAGTFRLTTTNGDVLNVQMVAPSLHVQTGFGKSELPVKMIRSIKISSADAAGTSSLTNSLISYWNFDGSNPNSYAADGGNPSYILRTGNDGRGMVNPGSVVPGKIGNAIEFGNSGNQGLFIPSGGFPILTTFTITAWVKLNSAQNQSNRSLIACSWDGFDGWNFFMDIYNGQLEGVVGIGGRVMGPPPAIMDRQVDFRDMQWHFCTFQCLDGNCIRVKVDNDGWSTLPISGSLAGAQPRPFQMGQNIAQSVYNANCSIDMLGVWTRTLSDSEVAQLYNQGDGLEYPFSGSLPSHALPTAVSSASETGSQLTLDLRDGSRVVGKSLDDPLKFHSASLGDFKLPVAGIRSIEFNEKGDGGARLTTTNGDVLDVQLVFPLLHVQTGFGKSEVPVKLIRSIKILSAGGPDQIGGMPPGLVALWQGNGNGDDSVGTNNAIVPAGITYAPAKIGEGFQFNGNVGGLSIPPSPDLNAGLSSGFTLACWIAPTSATIQDPLMEWGGNGLVNGVHFWISAYSGGIGGPGCIYANIVDTANQSHIFSSPPRIIQAGVLQHVALTYDKESGIAKMYYNGSLVASQNFGSFTPMTDKGLLIGERNERDEIHYQGILNEISIFSRALTADEIQAMYKDQNGGMAPMTPSPSLKPSGPISGTSTNEAGSQVTLELRDGSRVVGKSLDDPIKFHSASLGDFKLPVAGIRSIEFNDKGDGGAARLTSTNGDVLDVQLVAQSLHVQTGFGKSEVPVKLIRNIKISSIGHLTQSSSGMPLGLVALWSGNGNGDGSVGTNNAIVPEGITYAPAKMGEGFQFDGNSGGLNIPASPELNVGAGPGFTLGCWISPRSIASQEPLMEWRVGTHFWISVRGPGCLYANIADTGGLFHTISSANGIIQPDVFQYVAVTYDKATGIANLYDNGSLVASQNLGSFTPKTDSPLLIGEREDGEEVRYQGILNQLSIFNRALSADEIQAIYTAQNGGASRPNPTPFPSSTAPHSSNATRSRLTLELRDGSRVVGKIIDDPLKFHSSSLGDFKLPVADIRSIEFTAKGDGGSARLTMTNGDVLDVQLVASSLHVETSFGKSQLPVQLIRSVKASSMGTSEQLSSGLINVDFGSGGSRGYSQKTGFAAVGQTPGDFWNFYDRDFSPNPNNWQRRGSLPNLKLADGATTPVGMSVSDAAGSWNDDSSDPMYKTYDYPLDGGNNFVTFTNLPPGQYEVLAYSPDGNYELTVGGTMQTIQEPPVFSEERATHRSDFRQSGLRMDSLDAPMLRDEAVWADSSEPIAGNHISPLEPAKLTTLDEKIGFGPGKSLDWTFSTANRRAILPGMASGNNEIIVGGTSYGIRTTHDAPVSFVPVWMEGVQYARWRNVTVAPGQSLTLTVRRGTGGWAILSGVQILSEALADSSLTAPPSEARVDSAVALVPERVKMTRPSWVLRP